MPWTWRETFLPVRVYYEDTDAGGVVYHAGYLRFFERGRTEWLRQLGFDQSRVREQHQILFAVYSMDIRFLKPARFDDNLLVSTRVVSLARASMVFDQRIVAPPPLVENSQQSREDTPICAAHVKIACLDAQVFRPRALPESIKEEILRARVE